MYYKAAIFGMPHSRLCIMYVHIGDEGPQGPPTRKTVIKVYLSPIFRPERAVISKLSSPANQRNVDGHLCRCGSSWGGGAKSYCNCNPLMRGRQIN